ncbi:MAG: PAS domain S-box protein [Pseudomonadota bacterium]
MRDDIVLEISQSIPTMLGYIDHNQRYKYANRAYLESNSISLDSLTDAKVCDVLSEAQFGQIKPYIEAALAGEQQQFFIDKVDDLGRFRTLQVNYVPDIRADKTVRGIFFTVTDVSDSLIAGAHNKHLFDLVFEHGPIGIGMLNKDLFFTSVNTHLATMLGYSITEMIGRSVLDITHPDDLDMVRAEMDAAFGDEKRMIAVEKRYLHKNGRIVYGLWRARTVIDAKSKRTETLNIVENITDRKLAEERINQTEKIAAIGQLAGGIAHDFNNLLSIILGNLDLVQDQLADLDYLDDENKRMLNTATLAAERGASLTHRLLAFSRKQPLDPVVLNLNDVISHLDEILRRTLTEAISIEVILSAGLWNCEADRSQLESSILNLAINARDAMPNGGKLTIEAANVVLDNGYVVSQAELVSGQYVMLAVTDTGAGMPDDVIQVAIEPFFTTKDVGRGSGLGLSMAYGFLKQSGGHLSIYSELNHGTTVKFYLPKSISSVVSNTNAYSTHAQIPRGDKETILVVEDDADLRVLTHSMLEGLGYIVHSAENGDEALNVYNQQGPFDALLTDVVLPGQLGGKELSHLLIDKQTDIGILFMSGYTENSIVYKGRLDTGALLLQKPFKREQLAQKLRRALKTRKT